MNISSDTRTIVRKRAPSTKDNLATTVATVEEHVLKLAKLVVREQKFMGEDLRLLGAACIAFIRKCNGFMPMWNREIGVISGGVTLEEIALLVEDLYQSYLDRYG